MKITKESKAIGQRIKVARKAKKITLENLGKHLGISAVTVHRYESGYHQPKYDRLFKIAKILDVSINYFLDTPEKKVLDLTGLTDTEIEVLRDLVKIIKERKEKQTRPVPSESKQEKTD